MNFNQVVIIGKILTVAEPFMTPESVCGLKLEIELIDRYYSSMEHRKKHLTKATVLIYKQTVQDFILSLRVSELVLLSCKLGNVNYEDMTGEAKIGLIISPYLGEAVRLDKSRLFDSFPV